MFANMRVKFISLVFFLLLFFNTKNVNSQICTCTIAGETTVIGCDFISQIICLISGGTLPVELISFSGVTSGKNMQLNWTTATEINNDIFEVERSIDAVNWEMIGNVLGNGNSSQIIDYTYIDTNPIVGTNYYRLKQIDFDGAFEYLGPVSVDFKIPEIRMLPNPVQNQITLQFPEELTHEKKIIISNLNQQVISRQVLFGGKKVYTINVSNLQSGMYILTIQSANNIDVKRFVKQ